MATQIGPLYVRRSIFIQASTKRVWQEFETEERIMGWLNLGHVLHGLEPYLGGEVKLSVERDGEPRLFGGRVLTFKAQQELTMESQWQAPLAWPVPTFWTFRLTPVYEGTLVELLHHGFERLGELAADTLEGYEAGWDNKHLQALRALAEG